MHWSRALTCATALYAFLVLSPGRNFEMLREGNLRVLSPFNHVAALILALLLARLLAVWIAGPPKRPRLGESTSSTKNRARTGHSRVRA